MMMAALFVAGCCCEKNQCPTQNCPAQTIQCAAACNAQCASGKVACKADCAPCKAANVAKCDCAAQGKKCTCPADKCGCPKQGK